MEDEKAFSVIVLSKSGDYLVQTEEQLEKQEHGVEIQDPYIFNENEKAQLVKADKVFIPYSAVETIQYGEFTQETV
jgi:GH43 family beta-xylosidase